MIVPPLSHCTHALPWFLQVSYLANAIASLFIAVGQQNTSTMPGILYGVTISATDPRPIYLPMSTDMVKMRLNPIDIPPNWSLCIELVKELTSIQRDVCSWEWIEKQETQPWIRAYVMAPTQFTQLEPSSTPFSDCRRNRIGLEIGT